MGQHLTGVSHIPILIRRVSEEPTVELHFCSSRRGGWTGAGHGEAGPGPDSHRDITILCWGSGGGAPRGSSHLEGLTDGLKGVGQGNGA